jgi:hypothetical protein
LPQRHPRHRAGLAEASQDTKKRKRRTLICFVAKEITADVDEANVCISAWQHKTIFIIKHGLHFLCFNMLQYHSRTALWPDK